MTLPSSEPRKAALVTGAASGIGRATAVALAAAGFDVAINCSKSEAQARTTAEQAEAKGARTLLVAADVSDEVGAQDARSGRERVRKARRSCEQRRDDDERSAERFRRLVARRVG